MGRRWKQGKGKEGGCGKEVETGEGNGDESGGRGRRWIQEKGKKEERGSGGLSGGRRREKSRDGVGKLKKCKTPREKYCYIML